jgi:hypothetical protein
MGTRRLTALIAAAAMLGGALAGGQALAKKKPAKGGIKVATHGVIYGTITSSPPGITCTPAGPPSQPGCRHAFTAGRNVTLTVRPLTGWYAQWRCAPGPFLRTTEPGGTKCTVKVKANQTKIVDVTWKPSANSSQSLNGPFAAGG